MSDPVEFLRARLDEDEVIARAVPTGEAWDVYVMSFEDRDYDYQGKTESLEQAARWSPARALAEVAAKRRIMEHHAAVTVHWGDAPDSLACRTCGSHFEYPVDWPCKTILALAQPYADYPGFDPAWSDGA